jgi:hypothetical protein
VIEKVEHLLLHNYRRRERIISQAKQTFLEHGYKWQVRDPAKRVFLATRQSHPLPEFSVLAHCSVHDATDIYALIAFEQYLDHYLARPRQPTGPDTGDRRLRPADLVRRRRPFATPAGPHPCGVRALAVA